MVDQLANFKRKWNDLKTGYRFKVWFEGQQEVKTIFVPERSAVVYAARRARLDRQYDRPYTVYVYFVGDSKLDRVDKGDTSSIVTLKEMAANIAEYVAEGRSGYKLVNEDSVGRRYKIYNPITYEGNSMGHYLVTSTDGKHELYIQSDWDFPGLAETFGWNGKILPATKLRAVRIDPKDTASAEIYSAIQYLDKNEGKVVEDPGYWEGEY